MRHKIIIFCGLLVLLLSGCGKKTPAEALPVETAPATTASAEASPELEYVAAEVNGIPAVLATLSRGDTVDVVDSFDGKHYVVKLDVGYGLVEKSLVRLESEPAFDAWTGYAYQNAEIYDNYRLTGKPVKNLASNTKVEVLEDLGWCVLVEHAGAIGYMKTETLARSSTEKNSSSENNSSGEDGGEISMRSAVGISLLSVITPQEGTVSGKAVVRADDTRIILGYFDRGDKIPVLKQTIREEHLTVYLDGVYATVSGAYVQTGEEKEYIPWEGQRGQIVSVYADYWMLGSPQDRVNANTVLKVLFELENCYLVEVNGITGYVAKTGIVPAQTDNPQETLPETTDQKSPSETTPKQDEGTKTPTKPQKENTPAETTKPTEGNTPAETTKPTEESTPAETTKPTEENTPAETTKPTEENTPAETTKPTEGNTPTEATKPAEEDPPAETTKPTEGPTESTSPTEATKPTVPEQSEPNNSGNGSGNGNSGGTGNSGTTGSEWTPPIL